MTDQQLPDRNGDVIADIAIALTRRNDLSDEHRAFYMEVFDRFEALTSDRDRLRTAWESARHRARLFLDRATEARDQLDDARRWGRILEAQRAALRREVRAESAQVSAARDERDQALRAARSTRDRIAEWLEEVGSAWEGAHVRAMTLLPASSDQTGDTLPEDDMVEPGDEVTTLAELHALVERLAIDQAETTKVVTKRLATVEDRLGITDDHAPEPSARTRYRDAQGDIWERAEPFMYALTEIGGEDTGGSLNTRPLSYVRDTYGPLTPVTTDSPSGPCDTCGRAPAEQETGPDGKCRHTPATRLGRPADKTPHGDTK